MSVNPLVVCITHLEVAHEATRGLLRENVRAVLHVSRHLILGVVYHQLQREIVPAAARTAAPESSQQAQQHKPHVIACTAVHHQLQHEIVPATARTAAHQSAQHAQQHKAPIIACTAAHATHYGMQYSSPALA